MGVESERGPFGLFPKGPMRKFLFNDGNFKDRNFYGIIMKNSEEARNFRRGTVSLVISSAILGAYLGAIVNRLPVPP